MTEIKVLTTPYYVENVIGFDNRPVAIKADGDVIQSRPLRYATYIAFVGERIEGHSEVVIMNKEMYWVFDIPSAPKNNFKIKCKVPSLLFKDAIKELVNSGDKLRIRI